MYSWELFNSLSLFLLLQIFFLQGRFIFGPDVRSLVLTIFLIVAPVSIFCVFVAKKLMDDFSGDWGISIMVVAVAFTVFVSFILLTPYRNEVLCSSIISFKSNLHFVSLCILFWNAFSAR